ncbi:MAG: hypothetical protein WBD41_15410 [Rhodococcus sp. (in: high G+C Gram-positive bacteria)]|uniref:hypothetical protein n=1 Tax=Rhodococcus sp. EPR-157 TaxID=1813677 RepID=UPI0007BB94CC|nr:hypothetical protein [Rhodococcus sp. EPR-157]KZF08472.1 hypothetical protein A2J03_21115 [Rhodococcus sp. EPR-157]
MIETWFTAEAIGTEKNGRVQPVGYVLANTTGSDVQNVKVCLGDGTVVECGDVRASALVGTTGPLSRDIIEKATVTWTTTDGEERGPGAIRLE